MPRSAPSNSVLPPRRLRLIGGAGTAAAIASLVVLVLWSIAAAASSEPASAQTAIDVPHLLAMTAIQAGIDSQRAPSSFSRAWDGGIGYRFRKPGSPSQN
mgnify:CR=1 FL=1